MKATKDHISLETAKLLKDCGVESKYVFSPYNFNEKYKIILRKDIELGNEDIYPAYTWQEILWEYAEEFFVADEVLFENVQDFKTKISMKRFLPANKLAMIEIGYLLQQKKYDEADEYFREHCILINNK